MSAVSCEQFQKTLASLDIERVVCVDDGYKKKSDIPSILIWVSSGSNYSKLNDIIAKARAAGILVPNREIGTFEAEFRELLNNNAGFVESCWQRISDVQVKDPNLPDDAK